MNTGQSYHWGPHHAILFISSGRT